MGVSVWLFVKTRLELTASSKECFQKNLRVDLLFCSIVQTSQRHWMDHLKVLFPVSWLQPTYELLLALMFLLGLDLALFYFTIITWRPAEELPLSNQDATLHFIGFACSNSCLEHVSCLPNAF
ncbi:hypothetical protein MITS9509_00482 [Synechococcus sp. MIT S9509]|uniref:hypothetical protein n=1 Tax=Synechococcus sp. MIT S9509 TaxID=1801630 RepID=UPI0007BC3084|nr:hypothetical protein [Synechococcus sp. MIT S9509]KZR93189.1 hypothetical protein MITS9509_00482 [Synechococcus sp. MIT S9509]